MSHEDKLTHAAKLRDRERRIEQRTEDERSEDDGTVAERAAALRAWAPVRVDEELGPHLRRRHNRHLH